MAATPTPHRALRLVVPGAVALAVGGLVATGVLLDTPHYTVSTPTYHVSPSGDDSHDGLSPERAWRTLARADKARLQPGDRLLLEGGQRFTGSLRLDARDAGRAGKPVTIGSYGEGSAVVESAGAYGINVHNTAGVHIRDLTLKGEGTARTRGTGVNLYSDLPGDRKLHGVTLTGLDVSGYRVGIRVGGGAGTTGFTGVRVTDSALHHNKDIGLLTYGPAFRADRPGYAHADVTVHRVDAHHNTGDPAAHDHHTGNGIVLSSVDRAAVTRSSAHDNGDRASARATEGPIGIWAFDATRVLLQQNASYRNHAGTRVDGAGFGFDANVSRSVIQYNLSFGNDGPGYQTYTGERNGAHTGNVFRFNISSDDGRFLPHRGGIDIHGKDIRNLHVYQNTVVLTDAEGREGPALRLTGGLRGVVLRNNLLVTDGPAVAVGDRAYTPAQAVLQGNDYFAGDSRVTVHWGGRDFRGLAALRAATGQETAGGRPTGLTADPCFAGGAAPVVDAPDRAGRLVPDCSALAGKGLALDRPFAVDPRLRDYFGAPVGTPPPIGAVKPR
ncbi:right-handed parallel beta-helix repeat-containing protein [Streptomyces sp. NPDC030392]|uniref:right-handed parallel beta-helix repeat-containing protein n=1 Tax=Streptomyces sp. NPDC030392 TaxID=3155468 RepID=UPI0033D2F125